MSVNGRFNGIEKHDLAEVADRFAVPSPRDIVREVFDAVDRWPDYSHEAEVGVAASTEVAANIKSMAASLG